MTNNLLSIIKVKSLETSVMDDTTDIKQTKRTSYLPINYFTSINLLQFMEISPLNPENRPHPRSGHRAVATDSDFWIWGGYHPYIERQTRMFNELWRFNYALRQWTLEPTTGDAPTSTVASHSMCLYGNLVFVFGGTGYPFGHDVSGDLRILDLKRRHWRRCQLNNQLPEKVYGASMILHKDHLYILCGTNSRHYNSDVYDIHLPTLTCTQIGQTFNELEESFEAGRYRQEAYLYDNKIYLFGGGGSSGTSFSLENLPVFDLISHRWSFVHTNPDPTNKYPSPRKFHSVLPFQENQVIVYGGAYSTPMSNQHAVISGHIWIFNFDTLEWSMLPSSINMLRPTFFHASAINQRGEIWTHGGVFREVATQNNEVRTTTLYKMHTRALTLSEITWNYFLNCLSDRTCLIKQPQLMSLLNIPKRFSGRVY